MSTTIYALCDPVTDAIRYIGKTTMPLKLRLRGHLGEAKIGRYYRAKWIRSLRPAQPIMRALFVVPESYASDAEIRTISRLRALGYRLTNGTDGGEGQRGHSPSQETREKISASMRGRPKPLEQVAKRIGQKRSAETRAKMRAAKIGKKLSAAHRAKILSACRRKAV